MVTPVFSRFLGCLGRAKRSSKKSASPMSDSFVPEGLTMCIRLVILLLMAVPASLGETGTEATVFPLPKQIVPLSTAVTPRECDEVIAAIKKEMAKPKVSQEL